MDRLNNNPNVSMIKISGDIPFVGSSDVSLVLIDTPGPDNARDESHGIIQSEFLNKSSKALVLYIMESTFGSTSDNTLLERVASSMNVGGKQSKDRFIFVVNKLDERSSQDGKLEDTLNRVRDYLGNKGIKNPNLFPAAALPALNIRLMQNGVELDENTLDEIDYKVKKLYRTEDLHFEEFATSLPGSVRNRIRDDLKTVENEIEDTPPQ